MRIALPLLAVALTACPSLCAKPALAPGAPGIPLTAAATDGGVTPPPFDTASVQENQFRESGVLPESIAPDNGHSPFVAVPDSDSVLSIVIDTPEGWVWSRFDPVAKKRADIVTLPALPKEIVWSNDGRRALVRIAERLSSKLFFVDVEQRALHPIAAMPQSSTPRLVGFDEEGQAWAATYEGAAVQEEDGKSFLEWEGERIPIPEDLFGLPGLAHAWKLGSTFTWEHSHVRFSTSEACDTLAERAIFEAAGGYGTDDDRGRVVGSPFGPGEAMPDDPAIPALQAALPGTYDDESNGFAWNYVPTTPAGAYARSSYEDGRRTGTNGGAFFDGRAVTLLEPKTAEEVHWRGRYLLVGAPYSLYDAATRQPVFQVLSGSVHFWPTQDAEAREQRAGQAGRAAYEQAVTQWTAQATAPLMPDAAHRR